MDTTRDSVATLSAIIVFTALIGAFSTGHLPFFSTDSEESRVVKVQKVQAEEPQNNSYPVTVTTPARTDNPAVSPSGVVTSEQAEIIAFIKQTFGKESDNAIAIARCESGLRPNAVNHNTDGNQTIDYGLFQINNHWQEIDNTSFLFDYKINTMLAKKIFDGRGGNWSAWACARKLGI